jgi:hypothetical protein
MKNDEWANCIPVLIPDWCLLERLFALRESLVGADHFILTYCAARNAMEGE